MSGGAVKGSGIWKLASWALGFQFFVFSKRDSLACWRLAAGLTLVMQMPFKGKPAKSGSCVCYLCFEMYPKDTQRNECASERVNKRLSSLAVGLLGWRHNAALTTFAIAFRHCKSRTGSKSYSYRYRCRYRCRYVHTRAKSTDKDTGTDTHADTDTDTLTRQAHFINSCCCCWFWKQQQQVVCWLLRYFSFVIAKYENTNKYKFLIRTILVQKRKEKEIAAERSFSRRRRRHWPLECNQPSPRPSGQRFLFYYYDYY